MPTSCSSGPSTGSPPGSPAATRNATSLACSGSSRCCAPASATTSASQRKSAKRKAIDPAYKANRPEGTPAPIKSLADVKRGLDACGIRWTEIGDEEADDVIAALAASAGSRPVTIMSGDKDYYQLLTRRVSILNTARKPGQRTIGPADIETRYGITALQWCDYRALSGDPSDGLPSIRGIGPKTAARLTALGLTTLAAVGAAPEQMLVERFGPNLGRELSRRARFEHDGEVGAARKVVSESRERTFDEDIRDPVALREALKRMSGELCASLAAHERSGRTIGIKIRLDDFTTVPRAQTIDTPTSDIGRVTAVALRLLAEYAPARPVRLLGVRVAGLSSSPAAALAPGDPMGDSPDGGPELAVRTSSNTTVWTCMRRRAAW